MPGDEPTTEADIIRTWLAARDIACPVCGYNLRTIASDACPECGARLELRLGSSDLRLGPWLFAVLGVALPMGFMTIYTLYFLGALLFTALGGGVVYLEMTWALIPLGITAAYTFFLIRLIRHRRRFWKKPRRAQKIAAALHAALGFGGLFSIPFIIWAVVALLY